MLLFGIILSSAVYAAASAGMGVDVQYLDGFMGSKGLFGCQTLALLPSQDILLSVSQFADYLSAPGVLNRTYARYAMQHGKTEDETRKAIFKNTLLTIFEHNLKAKQDGETFTLGVNQFSDMALDEVIASFTGFKLPNATLLAEEQSSDLPLLPKLQAGPPVSIDWRRHGVITPPKNQGPCGSCVMFANTGALEASMGLYKNVRNLDLSEQEVLDCPTGPGIGRCDGNTLEAVFEYQKNQGQTIESLYPYEQKARQCRSSGKPRYAKVGAYYRTRSGDENHLKEFVGIYGPLSVAIEANDGFVRYKSGVMNSRCANNRLNHAVLVIGYGTENGQDYWMVKNSWGTGWGDGGYIKIARNAKNMCGIADWAILAQPA